MRNVLMRTTPPGPARIAWIYATEMAGDGLLAIMA